MVNVSSLSNSSSIKVSNPNSVSEDVKKQVAQNTLDIEQLQGQAEQTASDISGLQEQAEQTASDISSLQEGKQPVGDYALKSEIPVVPSNVSAFRNDAGYLTEHQDISGLVKKTGESVQNIQGVVNQITDPNFNTGVILYTQTQGSPDEEIATEAVQTKFSIQGPYEICGGQPLLNMFWASTALLNDGNTPVEKQGFGYDFWNIDYGIRSECYFLADEGAFEVSSTQISKETDMDTEEQNVVFSTQNSLRIDPVSKIIRFMADDTAFNINWGVSEDEQGDTYAEINFGSVLTCQTPNEAYGDTSQVVNVDYLNTKLGDIETLLNNINSGNVSGS